MASKNYPEALKTPSPAFLSGNASKDQTEAQSNQERAGEVGGPEATPGRATGGQECDDR
jgi:hypothetical protein